MKMYRNMYAVTVARYGIGYRYVCFNAN